MITPPHHNLSHDNTLIGQDKSTNQKTPHKTHPTDYLTQDTYRHLTQQTINHNADTLLWFIFYSAENHMQ